MPFFDDGHAEAKIPTLINHMVALSKAVAEGAITIEELRVISKQSSSSLATLVINDIDPPNDALNKLYTILTKAPEVTVEDAKHLIEALKCFDSEHGAYLPLTPLATRNTKTLIVSLNDFATFYDIFVKHMSYSSKQGELGDQYTFNFDLLAARTDWLRWQSTRPTHIRFDPSKSEQPALFEKFLAGQLKKDEWLTDLDIRRELTILRLEKKVHIVPFKTDDIGLTLHFEREKHQLDDPKTPYVIPLIVNLGEGGHSRIDSRGVHWTRMLITVDPKNNPPVITVDYKDELSLQEGSKKDIIEIIRNALKYREELGGYSEGEQLKIYNAFPECDAPIINVDGSGEQRDGFTCGYRALKGVVSDLIQKDVIKNKAEYQEFLDCADSTSLRNFVYSSLLKNQPISTEKKSILGAVLPENGFAKENEGEQFVINPRLVEGQLLALSHSTAKKKGLDCEFLERLVEQNEKITTLRKIEVIKNIATSKSELLELNLQEILDAVAKTETDSNLIWQVIFEQVKKNDALKTLTLAGTDNIDQTFLHEKIDDLPLRIKLSSEEPNLTHYLEIINARNKLLEIHNIKGSEGSAPWDSLFENRLFTPPDYPTGTRFEWMHEYNEEGSKALATMGVIGFSKLLHYMIEHEDRFVDTAFPFKEFDMTKVNPLHTDVASPDGFDFLIALKEHLQSKESYTPFRGYHFAIPNLATINQEALVNELTEILKATSPGLEKLEINTNSLATLPEITIDTLIALIKAEKYPTVLSFTAPKETISLTLQTKLQELENAALFNRRQGLASTAALSSQSPKTKTKESVVLGKIGKAILQTEGLEGLNTEVQIQEQQQQQVQQQIQTALDDEELSEEDEIQEESFMPYAGAEDLLTRTTISKLEFFITQRHPHLTSEQCWDLITGANADLFKYGVKKMTVSAAKILIENLQDVQYGLHPDNLPRGFSLQQDKDGAVVLAYTAFNPAINPNESPLTIHFSKPQPPNQWSGNALQFMTREQAESLYRSVIEPMKKPQPSLEDCISQFFFLKSETILLSDSKRAKILNDFIEGMAGKEESSTIQGQIETIFENKPSSSNIKALAEVLYEQGAKGLSNLLDDLSEIKRIKGDKFFASFKTCFIDPSQNLNELTTESAHTAMQKLLTLSPAQSTWWLSLTEQHSSDLFYKPESDESDFSVVQTPGKRWANLAELTEGFIHFCGQLDEVSPGLKLTEYCPLTEVADMRVALDRLLTTILPNALNVNEQFYQGLQRLSLDPLGPFYASRYEGYKLVTPEMMLDLDNSYSESSDPKKMVAENKSFSSKDFCFRCEKARIGAYLTADMSVNSDEKRKSLLLRYIATFNHRAPISEYLEAFNKLSAVDSSDNTSFRQQNLIIMLTAFGTGKRGKHFTQDDITRLIDWASQPPPKKPMGYYDIDNVIKVWRNLRMQPIRPTIAEIIDISSLALTTESPVDFITKVQFTLFKYTTPASEEGKKSAEHYLEALSILTKNKQSIDAKRFVDIVHQLEGLNDFSSKIEDSVAEFKLNSKIRSATAKLLVVCNSNDLNESNMLKIARGLYSEVEECFTAHGVQTTTDLLELLNNIDVEKSTNLPSLTELIALINKIANNPKPDYTELEQIVKSNLPTTCVIQMEKVTALAVEPAGNLHLIITKYMGEIRNELAPYKSQIDAKLGKGFFDSLATPEGTRSLLDSLEDIANMSGLLGEMVQGKVKDVLLKVYDGVRNESQERIGIKDEPTKIRLAKIMNKKINQPIKKEKTDFNTFCKEFPGELESLNQFLGNLQIINKTWPSDFKKVLDTLDNCPNLNHYPLPLLAHITHALVNNFDKTTPFPDDLLRKFLAFKDDNSEVLKDILDAVFDEEKTTVLNHTEKKLLCELALGYYNTTNAPKYIDKVLLLREPGGDLFVAKLKLLSGCKLIDEQNLQEIDEAFKVLKDLNNPELIANIVGFFTTEDKKREKDFLPAITKVNTIADSEKRSLVLAIALKAAQQNADLYQGDLLCEVIENLSKLDLKILKPLDALYRSPKHPDLLSLNKQLPTLNNEDLQKIEATYDRDYWYYYNENMVRDFDASKVATYLDNLQDMNYERPLLLSQREQLQQWFLYINTIGNDRGIPTQPWTPEGGKCKPIKDMSHEEIQGLIKHYRIQLKETKLPEGERIKVRLETIALLREAMYRGTGKFPRPTQILYLLTAMQSGKDFIAQIPTGQGKSITGGLAAAIANIEGKTVDICTSNLFLANEGLEENQDFFGYLGITAKLIHANSDKEEYKEGTIHYSSMAELALHRSKMQLLGKVFPENCTLIADEVDFSTLDDSTRYRYARSLDPITNPYKSPYTWIYESLVQFVDTQTAPKSDEEFLLQATKYLRHSAKNKEEKTQLSALEKQPEIYKKRLVTWLVAAGKTHQLVEREEVRFRVVPLEHKKYGSISKACILTGGRPNIQAEFSDAIQQFLQVRLRQKYRSQIDEGQMPDFLIEPEKTYITTLNSKILLDTYKQRMGMSGTTGSKEEIKEQYAKYGFRFVEIPPFTQSQRQDLKPILTNYVADLKKESQDHINRIVKETLRYLDNQKEGQAGPILIHCADKEHGEKIYEALQKAINKNPQKYQPKYQALQQFYSSEKATPEIRNQEEQTIKGKAGENGVITISTVFGRGTDIKPKHANGLYTIDTFVDTSPYSSEDLERSKRQKIGRSGRAGQTGSTRLIIRRSEFSDIYTPKQMRKIPETIEGIDQAISELNQVRNEKRMVERQFRESFDDVKDIIYKEFFKYIQAINSTDKEVPKNEIRDKLTKQWNLILSCIDERWAELQHDPNLQGNMVRQVEEIAEFACKQWNELATENGALQTDLKAWAEYKNLAIELPEIKSLESSKLIETISAKKPHLEQFYVKKSQQYNKTDPSVSEAAVYSDFMSSSPCSIMANKVVHEKIQATKADISSAAEILTTQANQKTLKNKFTIIKANFTDENVQQIIGALLYLRYKAYRDGNPVAYASLSDKCLGFEKKILWSKDAGWINAITQAQQKHFNALTHHHGEHENQKGKYLSVIMSEGRKLFPEQTTQWKKADFNAWWEPKDAAPSIKAQAVNWLTNYKDKWWTRGYVSSDRKAVATTLLENLQKENQRPEQILEHIAEARQQLLKDDATHSRSLKSSIQGRLYQYLNELELKIQAAMTPAELDANTNKTFDNVKLILKQAVILGIKSKELMGIVDILDKKIPSQDQYRALSILFNNVSFMIKPKEIKNDNWDAFKSYCQQTKLQLVHYFDQCDENSSFNEKRSIQVYQAVSEAAAAHFQRVMNGNALPKLNLPANNEFTYQDKSINFEISDTTLVQSTLFLKVNQADTYTELLHSLERTIVEHSPNSTQVQFEKITLDKSDHYPQEGFKLSVDMIIDGVTARMDYHINSNTGEMYCNDQFLQTLNMPRATEAVLGESTLDKEVAEIKKVFEQIQHSGSTLTQNTLKTISDTHQFKEAVKAIKDEKKSPADHPESPDPKGHS